MRRSDFSAWFSLDRLRRRSLRLTVDVVVVAAALVIAHLVRFEGDIPGPQIEQLLIVLPYLTGLRIASNYVTGVYRIAWRFVSVRDVSTFGVAVAIPSVLFLAFRIGSFHQLPFLRLPLSIIAIEALLSFMGLIGVRLSLRWLREQGFEAGRGRNREEKRVLLVGAGANGYTIAREMRAHPEMGLRVVGFVDDDPVKHKQSMQGFAVLGSTERIPEFCAKYSVDQAIITIARASRAQMRRIVELCEAAGVRVRTVPGISELVDGSVSLTRIRDVQVEDLLGRDPVQLDAEAIGRCLQGTVVMVTGAGGSIGSEMCRQVCKFRPEKLILVERAENNLFEIERELTSQNPDVPLLPLVADIGDQPRLQAILAENKPRVIIHAAAYKHVPLMEFNVAEAIKNNVYNTRALADAAHQHGVESFVMISTDKAVNPTSVMGASKRVAEMYVQGLSRRSRTRFITVRFGNVLGSVGSVIPTFKQQIAAGGPVTVTHPDMQRYFMTIPEASQLVLQAATMGRGGEIFILDMGEPMKIVTLAEQLIRLSGFKPYEEIEITFTGIRPGEKLFEEIALDGEDASKTHHERIFTGNVRATDESHLEAELTRLETRLGSDNVRLRDDLMRLVARDLSSGPSTGTSSGAGSSQASVPLAGQAGGKREEAVRPGMPELAVEAK